MRHSESQSSFSAQNLLDLQPQPVFIRYLGQAANRIGAPQMWRIGAQNKPVSIFYDTVVVVDVQLLSADVESLKIPWSGQPVTLDSVQNRRQSLKYTLKHVITGAYLHDSASSGVELRQTMDMSSDSGYWSLIPFDLDDSQIAFSGGKEHAGRFMLNNLETGRVLSIGGLRPQDDPAVSASEDVHDAHCVEKTSSVIEVNVLVVERRPESSWLHLLFRLKSNFEILKIFREELKAIKYAGESAAIMTAQKQALLAAQVARNFEGGDGKCTKVLQSFAKYLRPTGPPHRVNHENQQL